MDLISYGTLHIQTCISVQIFKSAYPCIPAPPELEGWEEVTSEDALVWLQLLCLGLPRPVCHSACHT